MAGNYEVLGGETTTELVGASDVHDVQQLTVRALPSGVVFNLRFDLSRFKPEWIGPLTADFARQYNDLAAHPHVVGVSTIQDFTAAGEIVDKLVITIASASGRTTITDSSLALGLDPTFLFSEIDGISANLDAIEAL